MKTWFKLAGLLLVLSFLSASAFAQATSSASGSFSLQGQLTNTSGTAIANGQHSIAVSVYAQGSTTPIYTQASNVTTVDGIFSMMVGDSGSTMLSLKPNVNYSVGISVDGQAQLQPMLELGSAPSAITAKLADSSAVALSANTVGGFSVSATGGANTIPVLNSQGLIPANLLPSGLGTIGVSSINGMTGNVVLSGGGSLTLNAHGDSLIFTGNGSGITFPFSQSLSLSSGTGFNVSNSLSGTAASFVNSGTGTALQATASVGNALTASSTGTLPTINVSNTGGAALSATASTTNAIQATTSASGYAALQLTNSATSGIGQLLTAVNGSGTTVASLSNSGLALDGSASGSASAVLSLQNSASSNAGNLISAVNASDSTLFSVAASGAANINSSASSAALTVRSSTNAAINASGSATASGGNAVLKLQNTASDTAGALISASNSAGSAVLSVASNGATKINSTANTALSVATSASGGAALMATDSATGGTAARLTGGLSLIGPVGTATLSAGNLTQIIANPYVKANSIVMVTVNSALSGLTNGLRVTSTGNGTFTVGLLALTALTSDLSFNYLIINQ